MSTTNSVPRGQKYAKASSSVPEESESGRSVNGFRTPMPRVLARFPDLDVSETSEEPVETLAGLDGRIINQKLATRVLFGIAVVLLLVAVLPLAFQRKGDKTDSDSAASTKPSWQPENPAPEASAAPPWNDASRQVDGAILPSENTRMEPASALENRGSANPSSTPVLPAASKLTSEPSRPPRAATEDARERAALANRGQSLVLNEDSTRMDNGQQATGGADGIDSRHHTQYSTINRASAIPDVQQPADGYRGDYQANQYQANQYQANQYQANQYQANQYQANQYQANQYQASQPAPTYRQGYGTGTYAEQSGGYGATVRDDSRPTAPTVYQESVPSPLYRDDSRTNSWQEPAYRSTDSGAVAPQGYPAQAPAGGDAQSAYNGSTGGDYRQVPVADYRYPSQSADYRSTPTADYPSQPYRPNYREPRQNDAPQQQYGNGYSQEPGAYRPTSEYQNGTGASVAPARGAPYYQADRRNEAATGYVPHQAQPGEARFQGTIEQAPASSGSRLY